MDNSPAESFISAPAENLSSLFSTPTSTISPLAMMTPTSSAEDHHSPDPLGEEEDTTPPPSPGSEKKPTKKRKSWGQVLPEPKTNLPPRKRAKTEDEKEQRRVERVLRNRRAAQSSRERKRQEVEALEKRNKELESLLANAQKANLMLVEELRRFRSDSGVVTRTSTDTIKDNHLTLSPELFGAQAGQGLEPTMKMLDDLIKPAEQTVNPASLSPPPESDDVKQEPSEDDLKQSNENQMPVLNADEQTVSTDMTQRPAEMLCDLPCHLSMETSQSLTPSQTWTSALLAFSLQLRMMLLSASTILSACQRPLTQIAMSSKAGFSLLPNPHILTTIIWLVTLPPASSTSLHSDSTSTRSSPTKRTTQYQTLWQRATMPQQTSSASSRKSTTLRLKSLRKILSSSPNLARPLLDATMEALRLVSEGRETRVRDLLNESKKTREVDRELTQCLRNIALPSKEVLMTLSWALKVETRRLEKRQQESDGMVAVFGPESCVPNDGKYQPTKHYTITLTGKRHGVEDPSGSTKRRRLA